MNVESVAAGSDIREPIILISIAGLEAVAITMAAGEYVSESSQTGIGPINEMESASDKMFASGYAIFSGVIF